MGYLEYMCELATVRVPHFEWEIIHCRDDKLVVRAPAHHRHAVLGHVPLLVHVGSPNTARVDTQLQQHSTAV